MGHSASRQGTSPGNSSRPDGPAAENPAVGHSASRQGTSPGNSSRPDGPAAENPTAATNVAACCRVIAVYVS